MANIITKYSVAEWAENEGMTVEEINEEFGNVVAFYADIDSEIAGCQFEDGTFGVFGCGMDMNGLSYEEMFEIVMG